MLSSPKDSYVLLVPLKSICWQAGLVTTVKVSIFTKIHTWKEAQCFVAFPDNCGFFFDLYQKLTSNHFSKVKGKVESEAQASIYFWVLWLQGLWSLPGSFGHTLTAASFIHSFEKYWLTHWVTQTSKHSHILPHSNFKMNFLIFLLILPEMFLNLLWSHQVNCGRFKFSKLLIFSWKTEPH